MSRLSEKLIALMLLLFILVYVGYQMYRSYYTPFKTETAFTYSVSYTVTANGVAIRRETIIDTPTAGIESSVFEDGTRVAKGEMVAEFYAVSGGNRQAQRMRALEEEIQALEEAQNPAFSNFSNTESISRDIRERMGQIAVMSSTGRFADIADVRPELVTLLNKKQVAIGREDGYENRISMLRQQYDALAQGGTYESIQTAYAPVAGFFVRGIDGYENSLYPSMLDNCTLDEWRELINEEPRAVAATQVGKVVTSTDWYFAALVPKYEVQWLGEGSQVRLHFDTIDDAIPAVVDKVVAENNGEDCVLIFKSNIVDGDILGIRHAQADIDVDQYEGLRISTSSLRVNEKDERGVYILKSKTVYFRKIDPIYEEAGFVISRDDPENTATVDLYDQIITKGMDLYDGKVIE